MASAGKAGSLLAEGLADLGATVSCLRGIVSMAEREGFYYRRYLQVSMNTTLSR
jgi:hypothetical protein